MKSLLKVFGLTILFLALFLAFRSYIPISISETDSSSLGSFLQILGTLYGIMAAFIVFVVWSRYDDIKEVAEQETDSLSELYSLVTYLEDNRINNHIKKSIVNYANAVISRGWEKL